MRSRRAFTRDALASLMLLALDKTACGAESAGRSIRAPSFPPAPLLITGATIIDAVSERPIEGHSLWVENGRIKAIGARAELGVPRAVRVIDASGKYVVPGLMNANVHLLSDIYIETLSRHAGCYEALIAEAAQVALKNGLTTVFDTWGPRRPLMTVRGDINAGQLPGSRIYCAGNIVGFDGPYSSDFLANAIPAVSPAMARRVNAVWVENVGRWLMTLTPEQVAKEVRAYIGRGIDFVKYAANAHTGVLLAFSPQVQCLIVEEAHRAGITAQAHTSSVEGLRMALEAGCDLIQHPNAAGPIPESTLELFVKRNTAAAVFPLTRRGQEWHARNPSSAQGPLAADSSDINVRNLIRSGVSLLLANDGTVYSPQTLSDPTWKEFWANVSSEEGGGLYNLAQGHVGWLRAMEEKGLAPMEMLKAATRNIAVAYGKGRDLGTVETGKIADLLILDKNPLQGARNYRSIHSVIKEGVVVDRAVLPTNPILTRPLDPPGEEEARYVPS